MLIGRSLQGFAVLLFVISGPLSAAVITFSGLSGTNGTPFPSPYTESGFTVTATQGQWVEGQVFGNPAPSIFDGAGATALVTSSIQITRVGGGSFTFSSVDFASLGVTNYSILGAGFDEVGMVGPVQDFTTIASNNTLLDLTSLTITLTPQAGASSFNVDNIVVSSVTPEPATSGIVAGLLSLLWLLQRRFLATRPNKTVNIGSAIGI